MRLLTMPILLMSVGCLLPEKSKDLLNLSSVAAFLVQSPRIARFLYTVHNGASSNIIVYSINPSTGALSSVSSTSTGNGGQGIVLDPQNRYAYATGSTANGVSQFTINTSSGALTAMSPALVGVIASPYALATEPTGKFVYVPAGTGTTIHPFSISTTGTLSALSTATGGGFMQGVAVDPAGKFVFFPSATANSIFGFSINANGSLTATAQVSIAQGGATNVAYHPNGRFLYSVSNSTGTLYVYSVDQSTGALSSVTNVPGLADNTAISITPAGDYLYVSQANPTNRVAMFSVNSSTGQLTALSPSFITTNNPLSAGAFDPSGRYFYLSNFTNNTVSIYTVTSGILSAASPATVSAGSSPFGVAVLSY